MISYALCICSILALLLLHSTLAQPDDVCIFVNTPSDPFTCPAPQKAPQFHIAEDPIEDVEVFQRLQNAIHETMRPSFTSTLFSAATLTETSTGTTSTKAEQTTSAIIAQSTEEPSATPLATPNEIPPFLSFSEWREILLAKEGRAKQGDSRRKQRSAGRHVEPAPDQNAILDSFDGGDTDFGFGLDESHDIAAMHQKIYPPSFDDEDAQPLKHPKGTSESEPVDPLQQSKDRVNYAMLDSGAQIMSCNKEARGVKAILVSSRDSYMLNKCSSKNKHFVVELSDDIKVDSIVLGNFEFFSSMFKDVRVSVSKKYPVKDDEWTEIGKFRARNVRDLQLFQVPNHETFFFARYVRIDFLSHYGHEYYCPLTVLRVHGKTEMEDYEDYVQALKREEAGENDAVDAEGDLPEEEEVVSDLEPKYTEPPILDIFDKPASILIDEQIEVLPSESAIEPPIPIEEAEYVSLPDMPSAYANLTASSVSSLSVLSSETESIDKVATTSLPEASSILSDGLLELSQTIAESSSATNEPASMLQNTTLQAESSAMVPEVYISADNSTSSTIADSASVAKTVIPSAISSEASNSSTSIASTSSSFPSPASSASAATSSSSTSFVVSSPPPIPSNVAPPPPTTSTQQESIYKTIMKRLTVLEQNATLSLQYIEEQSKMLKEVFTRMEDNQNRQLREFIGYLNDTAVRQVDGLKRKYETLWQATLMEVENYKEKSNEELTDLSSRVRVLTDEVVFEKRIGIAQLVLLLTTIIVMGFTRGSRSALPLPIELYYRARNQAPPKIFGEQQRRPSAEQESKRRMSTTAVRENGPAKDSRRASVDSSVMSPAPGSKTAGGTGIVSPVIKRLAAAPAPGPIRVAAPLRPISPLQLAVLNSPPLPWLHRVQLNPVLWVPPNKAGIRVRHRVISSPLERMSARNASPRIISSARRALSAGGRKLPGELLHPIRRSKRSLSPTMRPGAQMNGARPSSSVIEMIKAELRTLGRLVGDEAQ